MFRFVNRLELQCVRLMCFGVRRSVRFVLLLKGREPSLRSCTHGDTRTAVGSEDLHFSPKSDVTESSCGVTTLMRFDRRTSRCLEMGYVGVQTKQRLAAVRFFVRSSRGHTPSAFRGGHFSPKMHPSLKMRSWFIAIFVDCCE